MYGKPVSLTKYGAEGMAPDETARPGADMQFMVTFDPVGAGCDALGYCNPGADIVWTATGYPDVQEIGMQYSERCGHCATHRFVAPMSGTMIVSATSLNTVSWAITVSETDTSAGRVSVNNVWCGEDPRIYEPCFCDGGGLRIYFGMNILSAGNGMAYVDVLVNGSIVVANQVVSTNDPTRTTGYATIPCPPTGSTLTIRGKQDAGASVSITGGTTTGGGDVGGDFTDGGYVSPYENVGYVPPGGNIGYIPPETGGGTDILSSIKTFYEENTLLTIGGILLIGGGLWLFGGSGE